MCVLWNLLIRLELDKFILLLTLLFKIILLLLPYLTSVCKATTLLLFAGILKAFKTSCNISCTATAQKGKFDAYKEALEHAMKEQSSHWTDKIKPLCQHTNSGCLYIWDRWDLPLARLWPRAGLSPRGRHLWRAPWTQRGWSWLAVKNVLRPQTKSQKQGSISRISASGCVLRVPNRQQPRKLLFGIARSLRCQAWVLWLTEIIEELFS